MSMLAASRLFGALLLCCAVVPATAQEPQPLTLHFDFFITISKRRK